jgi:hypothetical protein
MTSGLLSAFSKRSAILLRKASKSCAVCAAGGRTRQECATDSCTAASMHALMGPAAAHTTTHLCLGPDQHCTLTARTTAAGASVAGVQAGGRGAVPRPQHHQKAVSRALQQLHTAAALRIYTHGPRIMLRWCTHQQATHHPAWGPPQRDCASQAAPQAWPSAGPRACWRREGMCCGGLPTS